MIFLLPNIWISFNSVIIFPPITGGLDEALNNIIQLCSEQDVPFVFALGKRALGRACAKLVPVSVVGLFNYEGSVVCVLFCRECDPQPSICMKAVPSCKVVPLRRCSVLAGQPQVTTCSCTFLNKRAIASRAHFIPPFFSLNDMFILLQPPVRK